MKYIVGIDEVGRGPLAGPLTFGFVCCDSKIYEKLKKDATLPRLGKDSKKLSPKDREKYNKVLIDLCAKNKLSFCLVHISNKIIDNKGLSFSIRSAIEKGLKELKVDPINSQILLDGGLKAPKIFLKQKTIIKGDEKEKILAWASILAKVKRDKLMEGLSKKYPVYGFNLHKGYGTLKHRTAIIKYGLSPIHRQSFCKKLTP